MNLLHAHPWIIAEEVDVERILFVHVNADDPSIFLGTHLGLPNLDAGAGQIEAVPHLKISSPFIFECVTLAYLKFMDYFIF